MDFVEVEVVNWSRYNLRSQIKSPRWFALSNRILEDADFFDFTDGELRAWIYILCQASQKNSGTIRLHFSHADRACGIPRKVLLSTLVKLEKIKCIQRRDHGQITNDHAMITTGQDRTLQDKTLQNIVCSVAKIAPKPTKDFLLGLFNPEEIQKLYPVEFIDREAQKAFLWCEANKQKAPKSEKGFRRFFSSWLDRGWERERKTISSNPANTGLSRDQIKEILEGS